MSLKAQSLGSAGSAADLITITSGTNATPIVATFGANSGLKTGDRIAIAGVTTLTAMNGEWTVNMLTATTGQLLGSAGNGAFGGTARVARIFDATPHMKGHAATLAINGNLVGTLTLTAFNSLAEFTANDNSLVGAVQAPVLSIALQGVTNVNATSASSATKATSAIVMALTNAGVEMEVTLPRYIHSAITAFTSGTAVLTLKA